MEEQTPDSLSETQGVSGASKVLIVVLAPMVCAMLFLGGWAATHWFTDAPGEWGGQARRAYRTSRTLAVSKDDWSVRAEYASQLMAVEMLSPPIMRDYLAFRVNVHCRRAVELAPEGQAEACRYPDLERAWRRRDGRALLKGAVAQVPDAPGTHRQTVHRYAASGASLVGDWNAAAEHFAIAADASGLQADALTAGWAAIKNGDAEAGLAYLARAEELNEGYPGRPYRQANMLPMRPRERDALLTGYRVRAEFFHALRASGEAMLRGEAAPVPDWPGGIYG